MNKSLLQMLAEEPPAHIANRRAPALGRLRSDSDDGDLDGDAAAAVLSARALAKEREKEKMKAETLKPANTGEVKRNSSPAPHRSPIVAKSSKEEDEASVGASRGAKTSDGPREMTRRNSSSWQRANLVKSPTTISATPNVPVSTVEKLAMLKASGDSADDTQNPQEVSTPPPASSLPPVPPPKRPISSTNEEHEPVPDAKPSTLFPRHFVRAPPPEPHSDAPQERIPDSSDVYARQRRETLGDIKLPEAPSPNTKLPKERANFAFHFGETKTEATVSFGPNAAPQSIESVLNVLCSTKTSVSTQRALREEFLLVYSHFMLPEQLMDGLVELFNWEGSDKAGIFDFVNTWIVNFFDDLRDNPRVTQKLSNWLQELKKKKPFVNPVEVLSRSLEEKTLAKPSSGFVIDSRESDWQKLSTDEIAVQLTLISHDLLKKIPIRQFIDHPWISKPELSVQIRACIERFNFVSSWTATQVVSNTLAKKRAKILRTLISVAVKLKKLRNFDAMMAVVQGLDRSASTRLKQTWENVPKKDLAMMIELTELCSPAGNYSALKALQNSAPLPAVPYLGVHLTELVYIDEEKSLTGALELNWFKMKKLGDKLRQLQSYQQCEYTRKSLMSMISSSLLDVGVVDAIFQRNDSIIANCILNLSPIYDDETLYRLSAYVEPKNSATAVGPTPKELLSPERRQLLENVTSQSEDSVIIQKRQEQRRINRLKQLVTDLVDTLPHSEVFEISLTPGLNVSLAGEGSIGVDAVVSSLVPKMLSPEELLAVSPSSDGFKLSLRDESAFLKLAAEASVKINEADYSIGLIRPMRVRARLSDLPFHIVSDMVALLAFLALLGVVQRVTFERLDSQKYQLLTGEVIVVFSSVNSLFARQAVLPGSKVHVVFLDDSALWEKDCIDDSSFPYLSKSSEASEDVEATETTESEIKSDPS